MQPKSPNQKNSNIKIPSLFTLMVRGYIHVIKVTSKALNLNSCHLLVIFLLNLSIRDLFSHPNGNFSHVTCSCTLQLSHGTKMMTKYASWVEQLTREQVVIFL